VNGPVVTIDILSPGLAIHFSEHPHFVRWDRSPGEGADTNTAELLEEFFAALVKDSVLSMPGYLYDAPGRGIKVQDNATFMRATFAGNYQEIEAALKQFD
jgi:hypothetical protein